jgi:hypothetical protein
METLIGSPDAILDTCLIVVVVALREKKTKSITNVWQGVLALDLDVCQDHHAREVPLLYCI